MTPKQVKELAVTLAKQGCCEVCNQIYTGDLYINVPKPKSMEGGKLVTIRWGNRPCKEGCGELLFPGDVAWWLSGWGVSHPECVGVTVDPASVIPPEPEEPGLPFIPQMPPKPRRLDP